MKKIPFILFIAVTFGCADTPAIPIPEKFQSLENLTVNSPEEEPSFTFTFEKDMAYGEIGDLIIGNMSKPVVDHLGRVYIADRRIMVINVFDPESNFIKRLGGEGRGPGEFNFVREILIRGDYIYAFDPSPSRVHIFDLNTLEGVYTVIIGENRSSYTELAKTFPWIDGLFVKNDGAFIAKFIEHSYDFKPWQNLDLTAYLYKINQNGLITGEFKVYTSEVRTVTGTIGNIEPFFGKRRVVMDSDNRVFMSEPDHFLVKQFGETGEYERAFYFSLASIPLTPQSAKDSGIRELYRKDMHKMDLPEFWPVVTDMLIDDQNQLWVATTVEDFSVYEWWVVKTTGELITRFDWPRNKPIEYIANGNIFTKETNEESGLQQVVRYRIVSE